MLTVLTNSMMNKFLNLCQKIGAMKLIFVKNHFELSNNFKHKQSKFDMNFSKSEQLRKQHQQFRQTKRQNRIENSERCWQALLKKFKQINFVDNVTQELVKTDDYTPIVQFNLRDLAKECNDTHDKFDTLTLSRHLETYWNEQGLYMTGPYSDMHVVMRLYKLPDDN